MSQADFWYVRFPDGRILRAANTAILRQELHAGHIPLTSTVRRSPNEEWVALGWTQEFAETIEQLAARSAAPPAAAQPRKTGEPRTPAPMTSYRTATVGSRLDPSRLNLVGVRGHLEELLAALDAAFVPRKLFLGAIAGILVGALLAVLRDVMFEDDGRLRAMAWTLLAMAGVSFAFLTGLLTRLTYVELARLRPARWREALTGIGSLTVWIVVSQLIVWGASWGLIVLLRWLPVWLEPGQSEPWTMGQQILAGTVLCVTMLLELLLWPLFFFWWLMPPLLVVEDCSVWRGLREWHTQLHRNLGSVFLYQAMAVGLGVLLTTPFFLVIVPLLLPSFYANPQLQVVMRATRSILVGLACAPLLTYWVTSNVFIYLNLRYGATNRRNA